MKRVFFTGLLSITFAAFFALGAPAKQSVLIECQKSYYTPTTIHLKKGEPAEIVLKSSDVTHGFAIDAMKVAVEVAPGPATTIEVTPQEAGTFPFYCVVRCGKDHMKMRGTVIVE